MDKPESSSNTSSWLKLFLAYKGVTGVAEPIPVTRQKGRPRKEATARKTTLYISEGDNSAVTAWENIFSKLIGKRVSRGETLGLIARVLDERAAAIGGKDQFGDLESLIQALISAPVQIAPPEHESSLAKSAGKKRIARKGS